MTFAKTSFQIFGEVAFATVLGGRKRVHKPAGQRFHNARRRHGCPYCRTGERYGAARFSKGTNSAVLRAAKAIAPGEQVVGVIAEAPAGKAKLAFERSGNALVSTTTLPEGDGYRVVLQIKTGPDAKSENSNRLPHGSMRGMKKGRIRMHLRQQRWRRA